MGFLNPGLEVRILSESPGFMEIFPSGCLPERNRSEPQSWKDNGGCLPVLDAGGRKFESCFPDKKVNKSMVNVVI